MSAATIKVTRQGDVIISARPAGHACRDFNNPAKVAYLPSAARPEHILGSQFTTRREAVAEVDIWKDDAR